MSSEHLRSIVNIYENVRLVIQGKDDQIRSLLCTWLSGGHILIEDMPGTGKTMLARAIAKSVNAEFKRVQFTPDLLPSDLLGASIYNQKNQSFDFVKGPIFTTMLLGDEINRATPRTQSALLEAMAEGQVTVEGTANVLNPLFFVMATQNPIEQHGTFPLPEAQLDRFMMKISMGYMKPAEEVHMIKNQNSVHPINSIQPVASENDLMEIRKLIPQITVSDQIYEYAMALVSKTRESKDIKVGASPRATIALIRASQTLAFFEGIDYVRPSHVYHLAPKILCHRLALTAEARLEGRSVNAVLSQLMKEIQVPVDGRIKHEAS
jgi:MoxR-like ATPase